MIIKCKLGLHAWSDWYTYKSTRRQERFCEQCQTVEKRELPILPIQILEILKMDISRGEMERKLDSLSDEYGYQKFTTAMLTIARKRFRVPHRECRYETRNRLVQFYLYERNHAHIAKEFAGNMIAKLTNSEDRY